MDEPQSDAEDTMATAVDLGRLEVSGVGNASLEISTPATIQMEDASRRSAGLGSLSAESTGEVRPAATSNAVTATARLNIESHPPTVTVRRASIRWVLPADVPQPLLATAARLRAADDIEAALADILAQVHEPTAAAIIDELVAPLTDLVVRALRLDEQVVTWWASHRDGFVVAADRVGTAQELGRKLKVGGEVLEVLANLATILGFIFQVVRR